MDTYIRAVLIGQRRLGKTSGENINGWWWWSPSDNGNKCFCSMLLNEYILFLQNNPLSLWETLHKEFTAHWNSHLKSLCKTSDFTDSSVI